jgi:hypothetical protein
MKTYFRFFLLTNALIFMNALMCPMASDALVVKRWWMENWQCKSSNNQKIYIGYGVAGDDTEVWLTWAINPSKKVNYAILRSSATEVAGTDRPDGGESNLIFTKLPDVGREHRATGKMLYRNTVSTYRCTTGDFSSLDSGATSPTTSPSSISIAGVWKSSEGTITFKQLDSNVSATYTQDNGAVEGSISNNILTGYWIEDGSNRRCNAPRNGRYYWGRIRFVFDGSSFRGAWGYCDDEPSRSWTGNR